MDLEEKKEWENLLIDLLWQLDDITTIMSSEDFTKEEKNKFKLITKVILTYDIQSWLDEINL